jgi:hypothetical protein
MRLDCRIAFLVLASCTAARANMPDWVSSGGSTPRYPRERFAIGFAVVLGGTDPLASAKAQATSDLSARLVVRIESQTVDVMRQEGDSFRQEIAAVTRQTSDVRLTGLQYETSQQGDRAYALAIVERATAAGEERRLRDLAVARAREAALQGAASENDNREADALRAYFAVRVAVDKAVAHDGIARALSGDASGLPNELAVTKRRAEERIAVLFRKPVSTLRDAVESIALQLDRQGVAASARWTVAPLTYRATSFSSILGRSLSDDLSRALAAGAADKARDLALRGSYLEEGDALRLKVLASDVRTGQLVGGAEAMVPKSAIPAELPFVPQNLMQALQDERLLAGADEVVSGDLHFDIVTNLPGGRRDILLVDKQQFKLMMRVNKKAFVRLVYLLANGMRVLLEQAYYLDDSKRNVWVEYPSRFEVIAPFGVERFQAVAFTERPEPLLTKKVMLAGEEYNVVADDAPQALVKHRGLRLKKSAPEMSEAVLTMTTTPK